MRQFIFPIISASMLTPALASDLPTNPAVTQETIFSTICVSGYSKMVRPPVSYTNAIKKQRMREMGLPMELIGDFQLDHVIAISSGGSPDDPRNLVLQDHDDAEIKDGLENAMHKAICSGQISLRDAQMKLWNWRAGQ